MNTDMLTMNDLFKQLGLEHTEKAINEFLQQHAPLSAKFTLLQLPFWSSSQVAFLKQAIALDSEWGSLVDQLDTRLRQRTGSTIILPLA